MLAQQIISPGGMINNWRTSGKSLGHIVMYAFFFYKYFTNVTIETGHVLYGDF
jgi:hypothetical protein